MSLTFDIIKIKIDIKIFFLNQLKILNDKGLNSYTQVNK